MPWHIEKGGGKCKSGEWAVIKDSDGSTAGCHDSKESAKKQLAALYANEGGKSVQVHSHIARVHLLPASRVAQLREVLQQRDITEDSLFFWEAEISNDLLDSYFTHMTEQTLRNYAEDAQRGVAFLAGHNWKSLPIGYSVSGELVESDGRKRVMADFYTVRGLEETDSLILRMQAHILRDVSVGFHGGTTTCDICGRDIWDWDCRHMPGVTYEEKKDGKTVTVLSTFSIDGARLSEVSGVFDGSTPEAMIRKAQALSARGEFTPQQVHLLEERYRVALPVSASFPSVAIPAQEARKNMTEEEIARIRAMLSLGSDGDVLSGIEAMSKALSDAQARVQVLEPQAQEGVQYRTDLIEEALAEGVRAGGAKFDREVYAALLKSAPLAAIKRMRDDWKQVADAVLPAGRKSVDGVEQGVRPPSLVADSAYRA